MDYRKFGECYYIRMDRDDEIISTILEICKKENVRSATFSGIGGCKDANLYPRDRQLRRTAYFRNA